MIVRMKEILLFTSAEAVDATIESLGHLGVVDIKQVNEVTAPVLERLVEQIKNAKDALHILQEYEHTSEQPTDHYTNTASKDPKRLVDRLLKSQEVKDSIVKSLEETQEQLNFYAVWGQNAKQKELNHLQEKGIYTRLYYLGKGQIKLLPEDKVLVQLKEINGKTPVALFAQNQTEKLSFKEEPIPPLSYKALLTLKDRKLRQLKQVDIFLGELKAHTEILEEYLQYLEDRLNTASAIEGMGDIQNKVSYLRGYLPNDAIAAFKTVANKEKWGYSITDPSNIEDVPVYIKNPKWISIINPVMKFIDIVPGYKEVDVSIYFLFAFALFFAMLVGDAGYGLIFLLTTLVLGKKLSPQMRTLFTVLSGSTIVWGVLSGTYFGAEQIAQLPFLKDLVIPNIASFGFDNINFMMYLSFLIGAIHLTIAHSVRVVQFINSIKALSEIGWILLVWGLFFVVDQLVLGNPAPSWYLWLFIIGGGLVVLFSKESSNFLKSMGSSIANLPLSLISGFSDVVSYVRLFAVGMATAAVAASFNAMALPNGIAGMGVLDLFLAAIALLLGHTLNIALALMAVMVHGIRLNMLEFSGHLGVQFSGEAYNPFKLNLKNNDS
jgi:V/A-type H+-transporting ATPase subunit I